MAIINEFTVVAIAVVGFLCVAIGVIGTLVAVRGFRNTSSSNYGVGDYIRQSKKTIALFLFGVILVVTSLSLFLIF